MIERYNSNNVALQFRNAEDFQKSKYGYGGKPSTTETCNKLDKRWREPSRLIFAVGLIYMCTFNDDKKVTHRRLLYLTFHYKRH